MKKRVGVLGGTFDPPHLGHLILAADAIDQLELERLLWVLTPQPPHKLNRVITPVKDREDLLRAAIKYDPRYELSRVELERPGPHFSLETIRILKQENPYDVIIYVIGGDSLLELPTWHQPSLLVGEVDELGVMRRPENDIDMDKLEQEIPGVSKKVRWINSPLIGISSTDIRKRIIAGRPYQFMLPASVREIIEKHKYYHS